MKREGEPGLRQRVLGDESIRSRIAIRAYQIFEERGRLHGYDKEDWRQAEDEILSEWIAREEGALQGNIDGPEAETRVAQTRPKQRGTRTHEKQDISVKSDTAALKRVKKTARAKNKVQSAPAQKPSSSEMKSVAEPKLESQRQDSAGPRNRKKGATAKTSSATTA